MVKLLIRLLVILVPSYTAAYLTEQMVWVIPTLAASIMIASHLFRNRDNPLDRNLDESEVDLTDFRGSQKEE